MKVKLLVIGLAVGLVLGAVGTAAATSSPPTYKACATSGHILALEVGGKCPAHTSKVSIDAKALVVCKAYKARPALSVLPDPPATVRKGLPVLTESALNMAA